MPKQGKMKFFYICYEDLSAQTAWTTHIKAIVENLAKLGNEVTLFAPKFGEFSAGVGVRTVNIRTPNLSYLKYLYFCIGLFFCLIHYYIKEKADIFYVRNMDILNIPVIVVSWLFKCPQVVEVNGFPGGDMKNMGASRKKIQVFDWMTKSCLRPVDQIVTVSERLARSLHMDYGISDEKIEVVENGVDTTLFRPVQKDMALSELGLPREKYYVTYIGSFYPHHKLDCLVRSIPFVVKEVKNVEFILVGDGWCKNQMVKLVDEMGLDRFVTFFGEIKHEKIPVFINSSDLCIMFYAGGGLQFFNSIKMYEYLACGKPVLANKEDDSGRFVETIGAGIGVDIENPESVAAAIIRILKDKSLRKHMGNAGINKVTEENTWEEATKKIIKICERLK